MPRERARVTTQARVGRLASCSLALPVYKGVNGYFHDAQNATLENRVLGLISITPTGQCKENHK